jgi:hypothetical protein
MQSVKLLIFSQVPAVQSISYMSTIAVFAQGHSQPDILPDCRLKNPTNVIRDAYAGMGLNWQPIFCANCGADGGLVPAENCDFAFYLCNPCAEKWGPIAGTYAEPDAIFFAKVKAAQIEKYGRELEPPEIIELLNDENSFLSKLAKERKG